MAMAMALAGVGDAMLANWVLSLRFSVEVEVLWELEEHGSWKLEVISVFFEYSFFSLLSSDLLPRPSLDSRAKLEILNPKKPPTHKHDEKENRIRIFHMCSSQI